MLLLVFILYNFCIDGDPFCQGGPGQLPLLPSYKSSADQPYIFSYFLMPRAPRNSETYTQIFLTVHTLYKCHPVHQETGEIQSVYCSVYNLPSSILQTKYQRSWAQNYRPNRGCIQSDSATVGVLAAGRDSSIHAL